LSLRTRLTEKAPAQPVSLWALNGPGRQWANRFFAKNMLIMIEFSEISFIILFTDNVKKIDFNKYFINRGDCKSTF